MDVNKLITTWPLRTARPLMNVKNETLAKWGFESLNCLLPNIEIVTIVTDELSQRNSVRSKKALKEIQSRLNEIGHEPISWLFEARKRLSLLDFNEACNPNHMTSIYVILRDGYTRQNGRYGLYVGQTTKTPEQRFREHKLGINSGKGLSKYGIQLVRSLMWPWQKVPGAKRFLYESALHQALAFNTSGGPVVAGDIIELEHWPPEFQSRLRSAVEYT